MSKKMQRQKDLEFKGGIYKDGYDTEYGLSFDGPVPDGPLHGEASSANADVGTPRMPNRSLRKVPKGRTKGFIGG